jgi:hypothetical protein
MTEVAGVTDNLDNLTLASATVAASTEATAPSSMTSTSRAGTTVLPTNSLSGRAHPGGLLHLAAGTSTRNTSAGGDDDDDDDHDTRPR